MPRHQGRECLVERSGARLVPATSCRDTRQSARFTGAVLVLRSTNGSSTGARSVPANDWSRAVSFRSFVASIPLIGPFAKSVMYRVQTLRRIGGVHPRSCTLCGHHGRFRAHGSPPRWDARCPKCNSLERHRLFGLLVKCRPEIIGNRVIHFAAEPAVGKLVRPLSGQYETADLFKSNCDLKLNIENLDLPDRSVDTFIVSHVLEHVNDAKALPELFRCLRPGGSAIILVPIVEGWDETYENPEVKTDDERLLHFGQADHVRYYGADVRERIRSAGFALEEFEASGDETAKYGLIRGEVIFIAVSEPIDG
jgi:hypothetical protein